MTSIARVAVLASLITSVSIAAPEARADKKNQQKTQQPSNSQQPVRNVDLSQPLTLDRAIQIGLQNQNQIGIAQSQLEASRARVTQANSTYYPSIAPTFTYNNQKTTQTVNGQRVSGTFEQSVGQIGAQLLIFDTFKREENLLASRYASRASQYNVYDVRQLVIENISVNYYDLLRNKELVRVAQSSVDRAKTELEATKAFVEAGTSPAKDILQAQADYDNQQVQLLTAENNVRISETNLKTAMGILSTMPITTPENPVPTPPATPDTRTVADYFQLALNNRPDYKRENAVIDTNRHDVKIAEINNGLTVQSTVTEGYRVTPDTGENRTFNTSFSYPLFDAGNTRAQVREAKASLDQARRQLELTKQQIQADVEQSYLTREQARRQIEATQAALKAAQVNYDAAVEAQKEGSGTILDVITAQTQLVTAETNAVQAIYLFYTNDARLQRAIGGNDPFIRGGK